MKKIDVRAFEEIKHVVLSKSNEEWEHLKTKCDYWHFKTSNKEIFPFWAASWRFKHSWLESRIAEALNITEKKAHESAYVGVELLGVKLKNTSTNTTRQRIIAEINTCWSRKEQPLPKAVPASPETFYLPAEKVIAKHVDEESLLVEHELEELALLKEQLKKDLIALTAWQTELSDEVDDRKEQLKLLEQIVQIRRTRRNALSSVIIELKRL